MATEESHVPVDLSESVNVMLHAADEPAASSRTPHPPKPKADIFEPPMVDIPPCSVLVPRDAKRFTPPAQLMAREWSLVFACPVLSKRDLNNVNMACNFFRTVLMKYPPEHWRVLSLTTVEARTAENMTGFVEWQRLRSICTLEIGTYNFANMLQDHDLQVIFSQLQNLRTFKLVWSHLILEPAWNLVRSETLRSLTLWKVSHKTSTILNVFPNLSELKVEVMGQYEPETAKHLRKLMLGPYGGESRVENLRLTHLWVQNPNAYRTYIRTTREMCGCVCASHSCFFAQLRCVSWLGRQTKPTWFMAQMWFTLWIRL